MKVTLQPMSEAPTNGTSILILVDYGGGPEFFKVFWGDNENKSAPMEGWCITNSWEENYGYIVLQPKTCYGWLKVDPKLIGDPLSGDCLAVEF